MTNGIEWKSINTAPDTFILAWVPVRDGNDVSTGIGQIMVGRPIIPRKSRSKQHSISNNFSAGWNGSGKHYYATHWMPLPAKPTMEQVREAIEE